MQLEDDETAVLDDDTTAAPEAAVEGETAPADDAAPADEAAAPAAPEGEEAEVVIGFGDEPATDEAAKPAAPDWVRDLRKANREKDRRIRELEQRLNSGQAATAPATLPARPKMSDPGIDFDEDKFDAALDQWTTQKATYDAEQRKRQEEHAAAQNAWAARLQTYQKAKTELKVADFEDAEAAVEDTFSVVQRAVITKGCEKPAHMVYALGKNPKKAKELAAITDPVDFAFAVAKLETQLKVSDRKAPPVPERVVRGAAPGAGIADAKLQELHDKAQRTGDYTAYFAAKAARKKA